MCTHVHSICICMHEQQQYIIKKITKRNFSSDFFIFLKYIVAIFFIFFYIKNKKNDFVFCDLIFVDTVYNTVIITKHTIYLEVFVFFASISFSYVGCPLRYLVPDISGTCRRVVPHTCVHLRNGTV